MNTIKTHFYAVLLLLTITTACQNKQQNKENKEMNIEKFYWMESTSSPIGYPIDVYQGGIGSVSLANGTDTGPWGLAGNGMSSGIKEVPRRLDVVWLSYAENTFYSIDCEVDYDKMVRLFKEGYLNSMAFFNRDVLEKETYRTIVVGFAPGGVVVVWLYGAGKQVEIGRYQGKKTVIPPSEIAGLDRHDQLIFQDDYRKKIMLNEKIVPLEVQKANKNKPIPYGLWDTYREKYTWRPEFIVQNEGKMESTYFTFFNGEEEEQFDQSLIKNEFTERAVPKAVNLGWRDKTGQSYGAEIVFDEEEIFNAYNEVRKDNKESKAELQMRVNIPNDFVTFMLKGNDKEIRLPKTKVKVYKSRK
jgi:hypothetical protein